MSAFSVSISGEGNSISMIVTEGKRAFPQANWFDRSNRIRRALHVENSMSEMMNPPSRESARRGLHRLNSPDGADVQISVTKSGTREIVEVRSGNQSRRIVMDFDTSNMRINRKIKAIINAIRSLAHVHTRPGLVNRVLNPNRRDV